MIGFRRLRRLWQIHRVSRRYGLTEFLGGRKRKHKLTDGERVRLALEELGPVFVKFGQTLSTRPDILPAEIAMELTKLQDRVPPFPGELAQVAVEKAYGKPLAAVFESFDLNPLASASIAQVHAARIKPADADAEPVEVIVKVLRPNVEEEIRRDIELMYTAADLVERLWSEGKRLRPREVVSEYERVIFDELDLMREGANASQLRRNWLGSELIYHPIVIWDLTTPDVLVMERIYGVCIDEIDELKRRGVNFQVLAERGVEIFFKQVFRHNFFHADMHPGNIFVDTDDPQKPRYIAVDFGIVGSLNPSDQRYLAENFLAFFNQDYRRVAELHVESGWVPEGTRVDEFESAIRSVCEPIFNRPLKDISFGLFLVRLFQTARRFQMEVQPQLVLLQKTLLNIEGLGRQLYPELDLWKTAKPIMEEWMRDRLSPVATLGRMRDQIPALAESLPEVVHLLRRQAAGAELPQPDRPSMREIESLRQELRDASRISVTAIVGTGLLIAATLLVALDGYAPRMLGELPLASWVLGGLGGWMVFRSLRRR